MAAANSSTTTRTKKGPKSQTAASKKGRSQGTKKPAAASKKTKADKERIQQRKIEDVNEYKDKMAFETAITLLVMAIFAVFLYLSYFGLGGIVGKIFGGLLFGVFGWSAWLLPAGIIIGYIFGLANPYDRRVPRKLISFVAAMWLLLGISDLLSGQEIISEYYTSNHVLHKKYFECMDLTLNDVLNGGKGSAGLLGRFISSIFSGITGEVGAIVVMIALFILCLFIFHGMEFMAAIRKKNAYKQEMEDTYEEISGGRDYKEPSYRVMPQSSIKRQPVKRQTPVMQTVNLMEMNMTLDEIEENRRKEALANSTMEEIVSGNNSGNQAGNTTPKKKTMPKEPPEIKRPSQAGNIKTEIFTNNQPDIEINNPVSSPVKEESGEERRRKNLENIPVFRDELNKKFGKKRNIIQETGQEPLFPIKDFKETNITVENDSPGTATGFATDYINDSLVFARAVEDNASKGIKDSFTENVKEGINKGTGNTGKINEAVKDNPLVKSINNKIQDESFNTENNTSNSIEEDTSKKTAGMQKVPEEYTPENLQDRFQETKGSIPGTETKENSLQEENLQKEKTMEITEETIKEAAADVIPEEIPAKVKERPSGVSLYKRPEALENHGRIGGDNYVSASGTFNALNDSKEAALAELPEPEYIFPEPLLLNLPMDSSNGMTDDDLRNTAVKLQETLKSFNVNVNMGAVTCGPTVTRYELFPEQGVRVNKITNLADDLKLSLAAQSIRIEAPIPGKSAVGIEVPNPEPGSVGFRELVENEEFINSKSPVTFAVGKDIGGKIIITDIAKMPHLLIAGATGSGKSVCINTLIMSILYKADPCDVKLIMIDPKVVELSVYNGIPHLFCPVVTDPKEASAALNWAVREMMDRYNKFTELGVRNITGYNKKIKTVPEPEKAGYLKMPSLVIIVDEFADLMMVASKEVEDAVCRLAQLARAAGIHLVLATQRPSVNVITGIIKANIPSRIAFSVSSAVDSRTILDKSGAEKLIGKGDMLFFPSGYSEPVRVQGAFISDKEVSKVVEFLRNNNAEPDYNDNVTEIVEAEAVTPEQKEPKSDRDEYFEDAGRFVIESERAAAGQLQRRFSIGFNRAGRIIDQLHKAGVVGPAEGTKPRKILMTMNDFDLFLGKVEPVPESVIEETLQNYSESNGMEGAPDGY